MWFEEREIARERKRGSLTGRRYLQRRKREKHIIKVVCFMLRVHVGKMLGMAWLMYFHVVAGAAKDLKWERRVT